MEVTLFVKLCSHCRVSSARRTLSRRTQSRSLDHQEYLKVNPVVRTCDVILVPRAAILLASATDRELWPRLPRLWPELSICGAGQEDRSSGYENDATSRRSTFVLRINYALFSVTPRVVHLIQIFKKVIVLLFFC